MERWTATGEPPVASDPPVAGLVIDRDGTLTEERGYLGDPDQLVPVPGSVAAVARAHAGGLGLAVASNQAAVARGIVTPGQLVRMHERLDELFGGAFGAVYHCPHHPDDGCTCRKPGPDMPRAAIAELGLDPERTAMVGDHMSDCEAARAAGIEGILVATGHGTDHAEEARAAGFSVVPDLATAIDLHLERINTRNR